MAHGKPLPQGIYRIARRIGEDSAEVVDPKFKASRSHHSMANVETKEKSPRDHYIIRAGVLRVLAIP